MSTQNPNSNNSGNNPEQKLWAAADKLRNNMDAAEYKHMVLGLSKKTTRYLKLR